MILIVSSLNDGHALAVLESLKSYDTESFLLDLSEFPQKYNLSISFDGDTNGQKYILTDGENRIDLADCDVVWWRRPQHFSLHDEITSSTDRNFAYVEANSAWAGLWLSLDAFWINHPTLEEEGARKVYQLRAAQEIGLKIPDTCITSSPADAADFIKKHGSGNVIYKAFAGTEREWRETRLLKENEVDLIDSVKYAPVIFQEFIPGGVDLRITVIGDEIYTGAIYSEHASYKVDFRMVMDEAEIKPFELPGDLKAQLLEYMRRLELVYGAIDMRLTPEGDYIFLEINPSGQWLFVELATGQPITDALARLMVSRDKQASNTRILPSVAGASGS
jgi:glutathione synthase/RimK-type ligase-like ATP-grasp enzyme